MTIEIIFLTQQIQSWLNVKVARHLEAQATRLKRARGTVSKDLGADGPGGSVGLDRMGMPAGCYAVGETEAIAAASMEDCCSGARMQGRDSNTVHA